MKKKLITLKVFSIEEDGRDDEGNKLRKGFLILRYHHRLDRLFQEDRTFLVALKLFNVAVDDGLRGGEYFSDALDHQC